MGPVSHLTLRLHENGVIHVGLTCLAMRDDVDQRLLRSRVSVKYIDGGGRCSGTLVDRS